MAPSASKSLVLLLLPSCVVVGGSTPGPLQAKRRLRCRSASTASDKAEFPPENVFRDCPDCPQMVVVPAGSLMIGSAEGESGHLEEEGPQGG
jgi:formylglycine-generating enzyme required for sulfatase activity